MATVEASIPRLHKLLPDHLNIDRFVMQVRLLTSKRNKKGELIFAKVSPASFLAAVLEAADLGLDPSGRLGSAYIIPYGGEAKLIPGYRGLIDLAVRSGFVLSANVYLVHEKDQFAHREGFTPRHIRYLPLPGQEQSPGKWYAGWARFKLPGGATESELMNHAEIWGIRAGSPSVKGNQTESPWFTHEEEMAKKTVLRRGLKKLPLSPAMNGRALDRFSKALEVDDQGPDGSIESGFASPELEAAAVESSAKPTVPDPQAKADSLADDLLNK